MYLINLQLIQISVIFLSLHILAFVFLARFMCFHCWILLAFVYVIWFISYLFKFTILTWPCGVVISLSLRTRWLHILNIAGMHAADVTALIRVWQWCQQYARHTVFCLHFAARMRGYIGCERAGDRERDTCHLGQVSACLQRRCPTTLNNLIALTALTYPKLP